MKFIKSDILKAVFKVGALGVFMKKLMPFFLMFFIQLHSSDDSLIRRSPSIGNSAITTPGESPLNEQNLQLLQMILKEEAMFLRLNDMYNNFTHEELLKFYPNQPLSFLQKSKVLECQKGLIKLSWLQNQIVNDQGCDDIRFLEIFEKQKKVMEIVEHNYSAADWKKLSLKERALYNIEKNKAYKSAFLLALRNQELSSN